MIIEDVDHIVLYSGDSERTIAFYRDVLGCTIEFEEEWRAGRRPVFGLRFSSQRYINVHASGEELHPRAALAKPGTLDLCFRTPLHADAVAHHLASQHVPIEVGPVPRIDALGRKSVSIYFRDPDGNLVELMAMA